MPTRRVLLADDDEILRLALHTVLSRAGWTVVGDAADGRDAVALAIELKPDVVLMDLSMPVMDGIEATRAIRDAAPDVEVVVLTVTEDQTVFDALKAGAGGYLLKGMPLNEVAASLDEAVSGGAPIAPRIARMVLDQMMAGGDAKEPATASTAAVDLTPRETEILRLLVEGRTAAAVAALLGISVHTANAHVRNIYRKLEVTTRAQAVSRAFRDGLVPPS